MRKKIAFFALLIFNGFIFSAEKRNEPVSKSKAQFIVKQEGTTELVFERCGNFTLWQENELLNDGFKRGQLNSILFGIDLSNHDTYQVLLNLAMKSTNSIRFATQLLKWDVVNAQWLWEEPTFNGYAYIFDCVDPLSPTFNCADPLSPIINLQMPIESQGQQVFFGEKYDVKQIGFVTGGIVEDASIEYYEGEKAVKLVIPFKYPLDKQRIHSGEVRVFLPEGIIKNSSSGKSFIRQDSANSSADMSSSIESHEG